MLEAGFWGLVGGIALVLGAWLGLAIDVPRRLIGLVMAFDSGGYDATAAGLALGSMVFLLGDRWLDKRGAANRKRSKGPGEDAAAGAILTMLADTMIPEAFEAENRSPWTGAATTFGFALSALLTTL